MAPVPSPGSAHDEDTPKWSPPCRPRHFIPCLVLVTAAVALLVVGGVSAGGLVTLAVVLACPLMMVFMMRSMTGHGGSH